MGRLPNEYGILIGEDEPKGASGEYEENIVTSPDARCMGKGC